MVCEVICRPASAGPVGGVGAVLLPPIHGRRARRRRPALRSAWLALEMLAFVRLSWSRPLCHVHVPGMTNRPMTIGRTGVAPD